LFADKLEPTKRQCPYESEIIHFLAMPGIQASRMGTAAGCGGCLTPLAQLRYRCGIFLLIDASGLIRADLAGPYLQRALKPQN